MAVIQEKCEYSSLTIPNDNAFIGVAKTYVGEIAKKLGFHERDCLTIEEAVGEAVTAVIAHSFEPHQRATLDISCERVPLGLKVTIADQGLPFDPTRFSEPTPGETSQNSSKPGISLFKESMDEVEFHNLGPAGKEIVLIKYLKNRSVAEIFRRVRARTVRATAR